MSAITSVPVLLKAQPDVPDKDLAGVIGANMNPAVRRNIHISVTTDDYSFATGKKVARIIKLKPFGEFADFFVIIKRALVGVQFPSLTNNGKNITKYVLGLLPRNSNAYKVAENEAKEAFEQERHIDIAIANDCTDIAVTIEQSSGCVIL